MCRDVHTGSSSPWMFLSSLPGRKGWLPRMSRPSHPLEAAFAQFFGFFFRLRWWLRRQIGDLDTAEDSTNRGDLAGFFPRSPSRLLKEYRFSPKTIFLVGNLNHPKLGTISLGLLGFLVFFFVRGGVDFPPLRFV